MENINSSQINSSSDLQLLNTSPDSMNAESDDDSGIVAIANSNRVGSTASNSDEDQIFKDRLNQSANKLSYASVKPRVRFDDELPLSEQNMRKSCKKLFETLWHQNKDGSAVSTPLQEESISDQNQSLLPSCHCQHFTPSMPKNKSCCAHSDQNLKGDTNWSYDDNELLLQHYIKSGQQCPYDKDKPINRSQKCNTLDNRHMNRSFWPININNNINTISDIGDNHLQKKAIDCDAALDRIKRMSDRLESSSMVNAFARPAFIKSAEFGQTMDTLYETIFPTEKSTNSNIQVNRWLNSNKLDSYDDKRKGEENLQSKSSEVNTVLVLPTRQVCDSSNRKSILKSIPNDIPHINTLNPSKSSYISADQIYPDIESAENSDPKLDQSFEEEMSQRFSHSYSAGDDFKKGILRQNRLKSAISEMDLNPLKMNSSPKSKGFLQRFKSVLSRAFTTDRVTKQQSILSLNTVKNSRSLSQTDLSVNVNPKGSRMSIAADNRTRLISRSPSFVKNIRTRISLRRTNKVNSPDRIIRSNSHKTLVPDNCKNRSSKCIDPDKESTDNKVWGELIKLNSTDSSQVIQIHRQKGRAFGFFVARGTVNNIKGVFVSRMKDEETQKSLTGVLEIGDEILAIDNESVKEANIMRVNQLIANKDTIRLTIIPYMNNKYL